MNTWCSTLQQWCRAAASGGETKTSAGTVIRCWEYLEILGACKTAAWKSIPTPQRRPEVEAGPTVTKTRNEETVSRIYITKRKRTRRSARPGSLRVWRMVLHAERLEDNLIRRNEFANTVPEAAAPNEGRTDATKRARRDEIEPPRESANAGRSFEQLMWICDR